MEKFRTAAGLFCRAKTPASLDEAARTADFTAATEQPVMVMDWERWELVPEVLLCSGCHWPESGQVPLLDSHDRSGVGSILGSFGSFRVEGDKLAGRATFSGTAKGDDAFRLVKEGHLTDVSVGYAVRKSTWVETGKTLTMDGKTFDGPCSVVTDWELLEVSLCPIGADDKAKVRNTFKGAHMNKRMDEEELKKGVEALLSATQQIKDALAAPDPDNEEDEPDPAPVEPDGERAIPEPHPYKTPVISDEEKARAAVAAERQRIADIEAMCRAHAMPDTMKQKLIEEGTDMDHARAAVLNELSARQSAGFQSVSMGVTEGEKLRAAIGQGLKLRCGVAASTINGGKLAAGAQDFRHYSLREICREMLSRSGHNSGGSPLEMVGRALTTTDLPALLHDTASHLLIDAFTATPSSWQEWADEGQVTDFKPQTLVNWALGGDLELVPESGEYPQGNAAEAANAVEIETYGKIFSFSRQAIINDDLGAFQTLARRYGEAAARTVNKLAYRVLTANGTLGDGKALFHASHHNMLSNGGGAPDVAKLGEAVKLMRLQKDAAGNPVQIQPQFFLAPVSLQTAAETFFASELIGTAEQPNQHNIYGGQLFKRVYDAELDATSATTWYLAGGKGTGVTVFFLSGNRTPFIDSEEAFSSDGIRWKVRIDAAAAAVTHQGLVRSANA